MIGYAVRKESFLYHNQATGDKWDLHYEEYEVLDQNEPPYKIYYSASFHLPDELKEVAITKPFVDSLSPVLRGLLDEGEGENAYVTEIHNMLEECAPVLLTFKGSATAKSQRELEKKRVLLYKDIMANIHRYNVLSILPEDVKEKVADGTIPY